MIHHELSWPHSRDAVMVDVHKSIHVIHYIWTQRQKNHMIISTVVEKHSWQNLASLYEEKWRI